MPEGYSCEQIISRCNSECISYRWRNRYEPLSFLSNSADLLVSSQFQFRIHQSECSAFPLGAINIHASILPDYRGKHSDVWSLRHGETTLGISVHRRVDDFDAGEILHIERTMINDAMSNGEIYTLLEIVLNLYLIRLQMAQY